MKFLYTWPLLFAILSIAYAQDDASTEATNDEGEVKPVGGTLPGVQNPKPPQGCPGFVKLFGGNSGLGNDRRIFILRRRPTQTGEPGDFDEPNDNPSNYNPLSYNPSYNPNYGRRFNWPSFNGRRGGRGGFGGPTYEIPERDDVEFL